MLKRKSIGSRVVFIALVLAIVLPMINLAIWTFAGRWAWPDLFPSVFTLRGLEEIFARKAEITQLLVTSIGISVTVAILATLIGLLTARAIVFYEFKGKKLVYFLSFLPFLIPSTVFAMGIHVKFIRWGLGDSVSGVIIAHLICSLPYAVRLLIDGCAAAGNRLEEQAMVLGASDFQILTRVTIPVLAPVLLSSLSMTYIVSFSQYFLTLLIGGGSVKTFAVVMVPFLQNGDRTIASCYSFLFLAISLIVFGIFEWLIKKVNREEETVFYG